MFAFDLVKWWYAKGWHVFFEDFKTKLRDTTDTFSIGELVRTLFKPYKQIGTESKAGEPGLNIFLDKLISRIVGTASRLVLIVTGLVVILVEAILGIVITIIWPLVPLLPIAGIALTVIGVKLW